MENNSTVNQKPSPNPVTGSAPKSEKNPVVQSVELLKKLSEFTSRKEEILKRLSDISNRMEARMAEPDGGSPIAEGIPSPYPYHGPETKSNFNFNSKCDVKFVRTRETKALSDIGNFFIVFMPNKLAINEEYKSLEHGLPEIQLETTGLVHGDNFATLPKGQTVLIHTGIRVSIPYEWMLSVYPSVPGLEVVGNKIVTSSFNTELNFFIHNFTDTDIRIGYGEPLFYLIPSHIAYTSAEELLTSTFEDWCSGGINHHQ